MIESVRNMLKKVSEHAQDSINIDDDMKRRYIEESFNNGVDLFKSLLFDLIKQYLDEEEAVCCFDEIPGFDSSETKEFKCYKRLIDPTLRVRTNFFHIAVRINENINDYTRRIYAYEENKSSLPKPVKFDLNKINSHFIRLDISSNNMIFMKANIKELHELCTRAATNLLSGPYFDEETIRVLKNAYNVVSEKEKVLNSFLLRIRKNAVSIYRSVYEKLVKEYLDAPFNSEYEVFIDVKDYECNEDLIVSSDKIKMLQLFDSSTYGAYGDKILFLGLELRNGKKRFLPVQISYLRRLFDSDSAYGFDSENSSNMYDWIDKFVFRFNKSKFEKMVAGLKRVKKPE